jgi:hypothetical protein
MSQRRCCDACADRVADAPRGRWLYAELGPGPVVVLVHLQEGFLIEVRSSSHHVVDGTTESVAENAECLALVVFTGEALEVGLHAVGFPDEQKGGFADGPLEVGVADLLVRRHAAGLAGRGLRWADEAAVRAKLLYAIEAADVVDLIEEDEGEYLAYTGDGS